VPAFVNVWGQLGAPPPRHSNPVARVPESKNPSDDETLWHEPTTLGGTFQRTVSLTLIVTDWGL